MSSTKTMHLAWFSGHGVGPSGWNDPRMPESYAWDRPEMYIDMTRILERAGFDFVIFADTLGIPDVYRGSMDTYLENAIAMPKLDPAVLVPMMAVHTSSIGLVPTLTTTYYPPFLLARLIATLDHVTAGRVGWNVVTSVSERAAQNFGLDGLPPHDQRYDIADEYMEVCRKLWASWEPDSLVQDAPTGTFADPAKVHRINHEGRHFRVQGPLNVTPSPQGEPFIVQAGASPRGIQFAGEHADVVIVSKNTPAEMREFRDRIRSRAAECGRDPDSVKVLFIVTPVVGDTPDGVEAASNTIPPHKRVEIGLAQLSANLGYDLSKEPLDEPVRLPPSETASQSTLSQFRQIDGDEPTLRQIAERMATWISQSITGSAEEIADQMEQTFDEVGGDGFAIRGRWIPDYVNDIGNQVVGVLRSRGRVAPPTPGATLRERFFGAGASSRSRRAG